MISSSGDLSFSFQHVGAETAEPSPPADAISLQLCCKLCNEMVTFFLHTTLAHFSLTRAQRYAHTHPLQHQLPCVCHKRSTLRAKRLVPPHAPTWDPQAPRGLLSIHKSHDPSTPFCSMLHDPFLQRFLPALLRSASLARITTRCYSSGWFDANEWCSLCFSTRQSAP